MKSVSVVTLIGIFLLCTPSWSQEKGQDPVLETKKLKLAIDRGLEWMSKKMDPDLKTDHIKYTGYDAPGDVATAGFAAHCFLAAGNMLNRGKFSEKIKYALNHIISLAKPDGYIGESRHLHWHFANTLFLAQVHGSVTGEQSKKVKKLLKAAITHIANEQHENGGWMKPGPSLYLTAPAVSAFWLAKQAGNSVPKKAIQNVSKFIKNWKNGYCGLEKGNNCLFAYSMKACSLFFLGGVQVKGFKEMPRRR